MQICITNIIIIIISSSSNNNNNNNNNSSSSNNNNNNNNNNSSSSSNNNWRASEASETLSGVTQSRFRYIYFLFMGYVRPLFSPTLLITLVR